MSWWRDDSRCVNLPGYTFHVCWYLSATILAAIAGAYAVAQEYPSGDQDQRHACSDLKEYIFVGGTAGFDALGQGT